jgi:hypothetical protein
MLTTTVHAPDTAYTTYSLQISILTRQAFHKLLLWPVQRRPDPLPDSPLCSIQLVLFTERNWHNFYRSAEFGSTFHLQLLGLFLIVESAIIDWKGKNRIWIPLPIIFLPRHRHLQIEPNHEFWATVHSALLLSEKHYCIVLYANDLSNHGHMSSHLVDRP